MTPINKNFNKNDAKDAMQMIAKVLDGVLNRDISNDKFGFVLLVFTKDGTLGERTNYVSNCNRQDVIAALKESTGRFEGQPAQKGNA